MGLMWSSKLDIGVGGNQVRLGRGEVETSIMLFLKIILFYFLS